MSLPLLVPLRTHEILALGLHFFVLLYRQVSTAPQIVGNLNDYIEDITWPHGDTKFLFEC